MQGKRRCCAIYTRKSTDAGLEQDFNSLHAQREAAEAYIKSQQPEGWVPISHRYDDGGISGASLDRPALQRLLGDIREGKVDIVVVYKVDRLTRSLTDFAKLVELFEAHEVSFVSVTQQFNTTTSMGRLTLNVLLSFAQFEREVIGERIRDKIAASKAKGLWMGGLPPLGYDVSERRLVINEAEAEDVRSIFRSYLATGSVRALKADLDKRGLTTKRRPLKTGKVIGGGPFSRGQLYRLLSNPIYRGKVAHRGSNFPGQHDAIVDDHLWKRVQEKLTANRQGERRLKAQSPSLLAGKLYTTGGEKLVPSHAVKSGRRYRYYVRQPSADPAVPRTVRLRYPAYDVERVVLDTLSGWLNDPLKVAQALGHETLSPNSLIELISPLQCLNASLERPSDRLELLAELLARVTLGENALSLTLIQPVLARLLKYTPHPEARIEITAPCRLYRRGQTTKLIYFGTEIGGQSNNHNDPRLVRAVAQAQLWWSWLKNGHVDSLRDLARNENLSPSHVSRHIRLAFLSPHLIRQILEGKHAPDLTVEQLTRHLDLPLRWDDQERLLA